MAWSFTNSVAIYLQIIERIKLDIVSGKIAPGSGLPSVREMAEEAGVNPNTMQRALSELERQGLIYTVRTSGRFVTDDEKKINEVRGSIAEEKINEFFGAMKKMGYSREEIVDLILSETEVKNHE